MSNPFGACRSGHQMFRGGCPDCAADMVSEQPTPEEQTPVNTPTVGARVGVDHDKYPGVWIVKKINRTTTDLAREDGTGRTLRCPKTLLTDPPAPGAVPGSTVQTIPVAQYFSLGEFVRVELGKFAGLWVVIKDDGGDRVNLAKPGGDGERYLRVNRRGLTRVPAGEVLK